jgi:hypothetical protein
MKIALLRSGFAGRTLAGGLAGLGHDITIGTRDVKGTLRYAGEGHEQSNEQMHAHSIAVRRMESIQPES